MKNLHFPKKCAACGHSKMDLRANFEVYHGVIEVSYDATCTVCGHHMHVKDERSIAEKNKEQGIKDLINILN